MNSATLSYAPAWDLAVLRRIGGWFSKFRRNRQDERRRFQLYFQIYGALSRLSERELAEKGISRLEIADVAMKAAFGD